MPIPANSLQAIQQAIAEHQFKSEFVANLSQLIPALNEPDPSQKIERLQAFLQTYVIDHFAMEEQLVFPALLSAYAAHSGTGAVALIERLIANHSALLAELPILQARLAQIGLAHDGVALAFLEQSFRDFFGRLQRHAGREDNLLFPLLKEYARQTGG